MRKIIYKDGTWFPMLNHINDLLKSLNGPELRLYLALCVRSRGRARTVVCSNQELMTQAALDKESLPAARKSLVSQGLVVAEPEDKRREKYRYEIVEPVKQGRPVAPSSCLEGIELAAKPIPHEVLFRIPGMVGEAEKTDSLARQKPTH